MAGKITKDTVLYVVKICAILLVITMCVAALLSFVNAVTKEPIAKNEAIKREKALRALFDGAAAPIAEEIEGEYADKVNGFYAVKDNDTYIGYYADVSPVGFKGGVNLMVGLDVSGKVVNVYVLSHGETIGIGTKIEDKEFLAGFIGREDSLEYKKGAGADEVGVIDGISGATYSSKAVIVGVDLALQAYKSVCDGGNCNE